MPYEFIQVEKREGVLIVTMHDPATRNALGQGMAEELLQELDRFEEDPEDRALLLTGTEPSFCSGANVKRMGQWADDRRAAPEAKPLLPWGKMETRLGHRGPLETFPGPLVPLRIHELQKPSIAAVNGHAMGVGMGIALACDIRIASEKAIFSEAFVRMGLVPGDGSSWQLPRLIGLGNTFLLQYTGDRIDGAEAYRMGLASKLVPHEELMSTALKLATQVADGPPQTLSLIKYLVHTSMGTSMKESLEIGFVAQELARQTDDQKEAVQAFLEKRKPRFTGK